MLGAKLVAYLGRVKETRAVRQWADGERAPSSDVLRRLRTAYQAAALLSKRDSPGVVQAWFQGLNPVLQDLMPLVEVPQCCSSKFPTSGGGHDSGFGVSWRVSRSSVRVTG